MTTHTQFIIRKALEEDIPSSDITSDCLFTKDTITKATIISKEPGVFFGEALIKEVFQQIDPSVKIIQFVKDGDIFPPKTVIASFEGSALSLLKGERTCLNFIQRMSGIATQTKAFVAVLNDPSISVLDTRKTTPGLRNIEKAAVLAGGGKNHRFNLSDMVLIKENHLSHFLKNHSKDDLSERLKSFKTTHPTIPIEIEIELPAQLSYLDLSSVDYILFDNFTVPMIEEGLKIKKELGYSAEIEVSGNVALNTIGNYRGLDIDRISIGSITHSVKAIDFSMLIEL
jgi:nicotinate-nucleotide pyrophosphorylase (carboxylating)